MSIILFNPAAPNPPSLNLRITSKTATLVYLAWDQVPGVDGYVYLRNGIQVARTFNPANTTTHFSYTTGDTIEVQAISFTTLLKQDVVV